MTKAEEKWIKAAVDYGCVICRWYMGGIHSVPEYHHMLKSGKRMGHLYGFGLCRSHHQGDGVTNAMRKLGIIPRSDSQRAFERAYDTELNLLKRLQEELK